MFTLLPPNQEDSLADITVNLFDFPFLLLFQQKAIEPFKEPKQGRVRACTFMHAANYCY